MGPVLVSFCSIGITKTKVKGEGKNRSMCHRSTFRQLHILSTANLVAVSQPTVSQPSNLKAAKPLRLQSSLMTALPWHTGALQTYHQLPGNIGVGGMMEVCTITSHIPDIRLWLDWIAKGFLSNLDTYESILYTSRTVNDSDDYDIQQMMGIRVKMVNGVTDVVSPGTNALDEPALSPARATHLFGILVRYRLADIITILSGSYPSAVPVGRSKAPKHTVPVWIFSSNFQWCVIDLFVALPRNEWLD